MGLFSRLFGSSVGGLSAGSVIPFGPFQWRILCVRSGSALIITEDVIDCMWYQVPMQSCEKMSWAKCSLRDYLNDAFIGNNFTVDQIGCMRVATLHNVSDPYAKENEIDVSRDTNDVVFCLSIPEAWEYFDKPSIRKARAGDSAIEAGVKVNSGGCSPWWLRSDSGISGGAYVTSQGSIDVSWFASAGSNGLGVRPAMVIDLKDYIALGEKTTEKYISSGECGWRNAPASTHVVNDEVLNSSGGSATSVSNNGETRSNNNVDGTPGAIHIDGVSELFVASYNGDFHKVERLLGEGIDPNDRSFVNWGLEELSEFKSRIDELVAQGIDPRHVPNSLVFRPGEPSFAITLVMETLAKSVAIPDSFCRPELGVTNIYYPAYNGDLNTLRLLLEAGADPDGTIINGLFPLYVASELGHIGAVQLLVEAGADVNKRTPKGATALLNATEEGQLEVVRLLIAAGADRKIANVAGVTPLMAADHFGYPEIAEVLRRSK